MLVLEGKYYRQGSAQSLPARLLLTPAADVVVQCEATNTSYRVDAVNISAGLAGLPRVVRFPDGAKFECEDRPEIDIWLREHGLQHRTRLVQRLEKRWKWVVASVLLVGALIVFAIFYGIPASAGWLSGLVPARARIELGNQTEAVVLRLVGGEGQLAAERYDKIRTGFDRLVAACTDDEVTPRLKFRAGGVIGPNALAIPNGTIVITDDMLELASNREAVLGVLAHEIGHLQYRHGLQRAIQASSLPLLVALVTGDLGSGSALLGTIPMSLVENGYSQVHEREADEFARQLLRSQGMSTQPLADLFERLAQESPNVPGWLSTHPATRERVLYFSETDAAP